MASLARRFKKRFPRLFHWLYRLKSRGYAGKSAREIFTAKFERNDWRGAESRSGPGSSLDNTRVLRERLPALLAELGVKSLLDVPCGDLHWMSLVDLPLERYVGADIVAPLVEENRRRYAAPGREFLVLDLLQDALPAVDAILCRDCLVHFSYSDARRALRRMRESGATWLLTTTYPEKANVDILTGQWRPLNLQAPPFGFPAPVEGILEESDEQDGECADKTLAVWRLADLPHEE